MSFGVLFTLLLTKGLGLINIGSDTPTLTVFYSLVVE